MYAGANELLCISAASVAVFIRPVFWTRKSTYLSFILWYRVCALFWAVTASFNALRFDWCCCQIWNNKTTWVWRSRLGGLITEKLLTTYYLEKQSFLFCIPLLYFFYANVWMNCMKNYSQLMSTYANGVVLVSLLLTLNIFHTLFQCFYY